MLALSIIGVLLCSIQVIFAEAALEAKGRRCSSSSSSSDADCNWCKKHGPKGARGNVGPQGYQGLPGAKGATGEVGPQGDDGPANGNGAFFVVNFENSFTGNTTDLAYPFSVVPLATEGISYDPSDLRSFVLEKAGTYSFTWRTYSSALIANYISFNDTITSEAPDSATLFGMWLDVGILWGQAIITTANNYTAVSLVIATAEATVDNASLLIKKLY